MQWNYQNCQVIVILVVNKYEENKYAENKYNYIL